MSKFPMGQMVVTAGVNERIADDDEFRTWIQECILKHSMGMWGDIDAQDVKENEFSLKKHLRLLSAYHYPTDNTKIWIITEADRSATTVLYPDEY